MTIDSHQETLSFQAEVKQLLNIVVNSLYSNKEIFLRELVSNASDATDKLRFAALSDPALYENDPTLAIKVTYDKAARTLTISDNGVGMSRDEAVENLGTIAKSGTREFLSKMTGDQKNDAHLIGQFGVGFYSSFIIADKVTVLSRRAGLGAEHGVQWESQGDGSYTINNIEKTTRGTDIVVHLKEGEDEYLNDLRLRNIITKYSDHLNIPIMMKKASEDGTPLDEWETVNRATALWTLPKNQIKPEDYQAFYKHIAHDYEDSLAWSHNKIEGGSIDYTSLIYIPKHPPFDMWQRDTKYGLKLYVQRVFIMDQVEQLLPHYLRFVRGVVDTNALPLNVSREILQDHHTIPKLRAALVRHSLDLLDKLAKDEPEKYSLFWKEFGAVLKEGPAEDLTNRDRVAKLLRFSSTKTEGDEQTSSLDDYISRMKPSQKKIYYITADTLAAAKSSPHLEIFKKNDIEVLLLTDRIDEWVVGHLPAYDEKPMQSAAKGELALDELQDESIAEKEEDKKKDEQNQQEYEALLKQIQTILADKVKEVKLSHRLTESPACLVRDDHAMGPQMERLLKAAGQAVTEAKPILELNPDHAIIKKLASGLPEDRLSEWTQILYEQAMLAEGSALQDPASFVRRVNKLWIEIVG
tara:strand:- start:720 stop:2633 length:1914 start_codon:yes stop_codon:yes gene_type:complete